MEKTKPVQTKDVFFNVEALLPANKRYILWMDIMGMQPTMLHSYKRSSIHIGKFHSIIVQVLDSFVGKVDAYPMMDGVYLVADAGDVMKTLIVQLFSMMAELFVAQREEEMFLVRAGLSCGPVIAGKKIVEAVSRELNGHRQYADSLLMGMPMINAFQGENKAPPFGVYLDDSVRSDFDPSAKSPLFSGIWFNWCSDKKLRAVLKAGLERYFSFCRARNIVVEYPKERLEAHFEMAKQYFC